MTDHATGSADTGYDAAIEALERQLSLLWRQARANSHRVARNVHPDMEPAAYGLLLILQREHSMRLTDLAAAIGVGKPSVSRQIAMLEHLGLVGKQADPLDGRAQSITLTPAGLEKLAQAQTARKVAFHERLADWSEEDLSTLGQLLDRLNASYANEPPGH